MHLSVETLNDMVTVQILIDAIKEQNELANALISRLDKNEDADEITSLKLVIQTNQMMIKKAAWKELTREELQSYFNVLHGHRIFFQQSD